MEVNYSASSEALSLEISRFQFEKPSFEVRCPVHQSIFFNGFEKKLIDHPYFQRLRFISQLGFVSVAYPSAVHNRFTHSLGVMQFASLMWQKIKEEGQELLSAFYTENTLEYFHQVLRIAGLLHDLGHGPFSHSFEPLLGKAENLPLPWNWYKKPENKKGPAHHEDLSIALIHQLFADSTEGAIFWPEMGQDVAALISAEIKPSARFVSSVDQISTIFPLLKSLISGELDADRLDYLLRDSHFCGVPYGKYDKHRLLQNILPYYQPNEKSFYLALKKNALFSFEDFLMARYHMFQQVYFLKTIPPFDYYLQQAFKTGEISVGFKTLEEYVQLRDDSIWQQLFEKRHEFWSGLIVKRVPAEHLYTLEEAHQEAQNGMKQLLTRILDHEDLAVFTLRAKQYLSSLGGGKSQSRLYISSNWLGQTTFEPVENYSTLLARYNVRIEKDNIYCLKKDKKAAWEAINRFLGPKNEGLSSKH